MSQLTPQEKAKILEQMRLRLSDLRQQRDKAMMEKGLQAQDNNDLRENFAYQLWEQKEHMLTSRIFNLIKEIEEFAKK